MLNPKQGALFPHESRVYGKPWFWQRDSCTTESSRSLAEVIMEMRSEIKKLETENTALRGGIESPVSGGTTEPGERRGQPGTRTHRIPPQCTMRRNASAPELEGQYKENIVMTVRRYSVASKMPNAIQRSESEERQTEDRQVGRVNKSSWGRLHEEVHGRAPSFFGNSTQDEITAAKLTNRLSLQEYVHKNRSKVKTVTFLLPVDDIYTY
ncbi:hypothetical protein DPEC_G00301030 [Dallia pectoralis]|uniref:Uncharacterized protein n=1 Tax=Dallia pectoralis TaxID=75939 RepID=A0ACC2FGK4_DALPE|nr:hypothetical protein DPEC_G00301030 [Dallia pectoralis]